MSKARRPGPLRWLAYCFGFGLPERYREWVLRDVTGPTWVLRHVVRVLVQLTIPIVAIFVFIPAPMWVRLLTVIAAAGPTLLFTCGYVVESADHRLAKAGYDPRLGERLRKERKTLSLERQRTANARRRERAAARLARR
jgi:hypothetical protein